MAKNPTPAMAAALIGQPVGVERAALEALDHARSRAAMGYLLALEQVEVERVLPVKPATFHILVSFGNHEIDRV